MRLNELLERDGTLSNITATGENESHKEAIRGLPKLKKMDSATINGQAVEKDLKFH